MEGHLSTKTGHMILKRRPGPGKDVNDCHIPSEQHNLEQRDLPEMYTQMKEIHIRQMAS